MQLAELELSEPAVALVEEEDGGLNGGSLLESARALAKAGLLEDAVPLLAQALTRRGVGMVGLPRHPTGGRWRSVAERVGGHRDGRGLGSTAGAIEGLCGPGRLEDRRVGESGGVRGTRRISGRGFARAAAPGSADAVAPSRGPGRGRQARGREAGPRRAEC